MKFNHDADKVQGVFPGVELDSERVEELLKAFAKDPQSIIGSKKSETAEYLHGIANDPEALIATAMVLVQGLVAINMMAKVEQATKGALKHMDISDMPLEVAEQILEADDAPEEIKDRIRREAKCMQEVEPNTGEVADEFEALKRKYQ